MSVQCMLCVRLPMLHSAILGMMPLSVSQTVWRCVNHLRYVISVAHVFILNRSTPYLMLYTITIIII